MTAAAPPAPAPMTATAVTPRTGRASRVDLDAEAGAVRHHHLPVLEAERLGDDVVQVVDAGDLRACRRRPASSAGTRSAGSRPASPHRGGGSRRCRCPSRSSRRCRGRSRARLRARPAGGRGRGRRASSRSRRSTPRPRRRWSSRMSRAVQADSSAITGTLIRSATRARPSAPATGCSQRKMPYSS